MFPRPRAAPPFPALVLGLLLLLQQLVAGSGVPPEKDEELNAPREERDENAVDGTDPSPSDNSEDNYSAGIPGPLTRLFVLANRGLSNLIQDLILVSTSYALAIKHGLNCHFTRLLLKNSSVQFD